MGFVSDIWKGITGQNDSAHVNGPQQYDNLGSLLSQTETSYNQSMANQDQFAQALMAQMNGQGYNPAQAMLNQSTNQNIAQQAGLAASQKGLNPAMAARLGAQNAGNIGQQMAGQAAVMQQQQGLDTQGQLGSLYNNMAANRLGALSDLRGYIQGGNQQQLAANTSNAGYDMENSQRNGAGWGKVIGGVSGGLGGFGMKYAGGYIEGGEAPVPGDHPANDTVPTFLSPGEIVIPRSHANSPEDAKAFVEALMADDEKKSGGSYKAVLKAQQDYQTHMSRLMEARKGRG